MPLLPFDDAFVENGGDIQFWMEDADSREPTPIRIDRAALSDFRSANSIKGPRKATFEAHRKFFYALASAKFDVFGGAEDRPVVIGTSDLAAFPRVRQQFPDLKLKK